MTDARFDACLPHTLIQECPLPNDWSNARNFSNDAHDPGGATMCGIIQREYDHYRKSKGLPVRSVRQLAREEGTEIYTNNYWLPYCPMLRPGMDLEFFDTSVNEGTHEAIKILQVAIGVSNDGIWGPHTDAAVKAITDLPRVIKAFTERRITVYRQMSGFVYFGRDWVRRATEIGATALKMATAPETETPVVAHAVVVPEKSAPELIARDVLAEIKKLIAQWESIA
jgi:lysozyme family protein